LNWVDFLIVAIIIWFTYAAFHAGLIREVVTIIGVIFAVALAGLFYTDLAEDVLIAVNNEQTARTIAFGMIFGSVVLASQLIAIFLKHTASLLMLGIFDSMGGAFIGVIKGFIFVQIGLIAAITFEPLGLQQSVDNSAFAPLFLNLLPFLRHILPAEFENAIEAF
jgi:membrane protein required for colicin V production